MSSVVTKELAVILDESEIKALESRLRAIQNMQGNPMDVAIKRVESTAAFSVKNIPGPAYNTVRGASVETLDDILRFYEEREIPARFEVTPAQSSPELFRSLSARGFFKAVFIQCCMGKRRLFQADRFRISILSLLKPASLICLGRFTQEASACLIFKAASCTEQSGSSWP